MAKEVSTPKVDVETVSEATDLSLFGLIGDADFFVQLIMFLLLVASVWCWTIILNKSKIIRREKRISETLGAEVKITHSNSGKGKVEIKYSSLNELQGIVEKFKK